ncbi:MAG: hypothetical protein ACTHMJ_24540 [Thermomicrobiales bacterium]
MVHIVYQVGDSYRHPEFGEGVIQYVARKWMSVRFNGSSDSQIIKFTPEEAAALLPPKPNEPPKPPTRPWKAPLFSLDDALPTSSLSYLPPDASPDFDSWTKDNVHEEFYESDQYVLDDPYWPPGPDDGVNDGFPLFDGDDSE